VFLGNGDGTLQPATSQSLGSIPRSAVAADFNGDGRTDLAIVSDSSSNLTVLLGILPPVFTISSSHSDPFTLGQIGATYTISVKNDGPGMPSGQITVTDNLPTGLSATALAGSGWSCTLATLACSRSDSLTVGASYPIITMTVNVSLSNVGTVVNQVGVSGGGAVTANAFDPTSLIGSPVTIQTNPSGLQFTIDGTPAQTAPQTMNLAAGAHTIAVVSPQAGSPGTQYVFTGWSDAGSASHTITVGATAATYTASFKTQNQLTIALNPIPGGSVTPASGLYFDSGSTVTLTATPNAPYVFTSWSGGSTANPLQVTMNAPTSITATFNVPGFTCAVTGDTVASVADVQLIMNEALGAMPPNNDLNRDHVVNVADAQKVIDAVMGLGCLY
jgi:uncharacterized repeat protein (TIGR01451 family)